MQNATEKVSGVRRTVSRIISCAFIAAIAFVICHFIYGAIVLTINDTKITHFEDIAVCSQLDEFKIEGELKDKKLKKLEYEECYIAKCQYDGVKFKIYAYEFYNENDARQYFINVKGSTADGNKDYLSSSNSFSSQLTARYNNNVYRIETGNANNHIKVIKLINSIFPIELKWDEEVK